MYTNIAMPYLSIYAFHYATQDVPALSIRLASHLAGLHPIHAAPKGLVAAETITVAPQPTTVLQAAGATRYGACAGVILQLFQLLQLLLKLLLFPLALLRVSCAFRPEDPHQP